MTLIINLENFQQKKWYVFHDQNVTNYGEGNKNDARIKFDTKTIKSCPCDYSDTYIIVTGDITAKNGKYGDGNTDVTYKNCAPFTKCIIQIND